MRTNHVPCCQVGSAKEVRLFVCLLATTDRVITWDKEVPSSAAGFWCSRIRTVYCIPLQMQT